MLFKPGEVFQFADFTLDPSQRSLLRNGQALALPTKAFDMLQFMVENPGRLLTREEILKAVWRDTVVEEGNLSQNIFLVRKALGESANEQRFVITVIGSGYQFIAPVKKRAINEVVEDFPRQPRSAAPAAWTNSSGGESAERARPLLVTNTAPLPSPASRTQESRPALVMPQPRVFRIRLWAGVIAAVLVVAVAGGLAWSHWRAIPAGNIHILLAELENTTGDATFDHSLNRALQIDLEQSPSLVLLSGSRVRKTLKLMQLDPATTKMTPDIAREACQRLNGQAVLEPTIANYGGHYLVTLTARACDDGRTLGDRKETATDKAGVLTALDQLADGIRRDIGESRASVRRYDTPLYAEATSSLDALKAYSEGERLFNSGQTAQAVPLFQRAVELDPKFTVAYADLSSAYYNLGDSDKDKENITKAYQLRDAVSEHERFFIEYRYHQSVTGDWSQALKALINDAAVFPHDAGPRSNLSNGENWIGNYKEAVRYADETMAINHEEGTYNAVGWEIAARSYKHANMFDRALEVVKESMEKTASPGTWGIAVQLAALRHDDAEVERLIQTSRGTPNEAHVLQEAGASALYEGKAKHSQELFQEARVAAKRDGSEADLLDMDATQARMLVEVGLTEQAKAALAALPKIDDAMDADYTMAEVGDPDKAEAIAAQRLQAAPNDQMLAAEYAPAVHAAIAMRNGKPEDVINDMAADAPYEMRDPTVPYLLGQAYLKAGKPEQAIASFKKFLDNPGIDDPLTPLYALSYLGTARAQAMQGQSAAAVASYQKFFDFWKDADPDLPVLVQAHAEFAKLQH
jgi:DNA-binding winged helix-turn-helix (wHTH) protein/tetratricopeptide (TPR) repeat protein